MRSIIINYYQKGLIMMKKEMLFSMLVVGCVVANVTAMEKDKKPNIKRLIFPKAINEYRNRENSKLDHKLDNALIFFLNKNESDLEGFLSFKDASLHDRRGEPQVFNQLNLYGYRQCSDFSNGVSVIISSPNFRGDESTMEALLEKDRKHGEHCKIAEEYYKQYIAATNHHASQ